MVSRGIGSKARIVSGRGSRRWFASFFVVEIDFKPSYRIHLLFLFINFIIIDQITYNHKNLECSPIFIFLLPFPSATSTSSWLSSSPTKKYNFCHIVQLHPRNSHRHYLWSNFWSIHLLFHWRIFIGRFRQNISRSNIFDFASANALWRWVQYSEKKILPKHPLHQFVWSSRHYHELLHYIWNCLRL